MFQEALFVNSARQEGLSIEDTARQVALLCCLPLGVAIFGWPAVKSYAFFVSQHVAIVGRRLSEMLVAFGLSRMCSDRGRCNVSTSRAWFLEACGDTPQSSAPLRFGCVIYFLSRSVTVAWACCIPSRSWSPEIKRGSLKILLLLPPHHRV